MPPVISALLAFVASLLRSQASLHLEHLALRHQLAVYKQTVHRPRLCPTDRLFWAWLARLWPEWQRALAFVQPRTVIAWQQRRFREHWRRLSQRGKPGRPAIPKEIRDLIRNMWRANPLWGAPRIVGELRKLGIDVAKSTVEKYRVRPRKPPRGGADRSTESVAKPVCGTPDWQYTPGLFRSRHRAARAASAAPPGQLLLVLSRLAHAPVAGDGLPAGAPRGTTASGQGDCRAGSWGSASPLCATRGVMRLALHAGIVEAWLMFRH